jgi:hypothetical protein
MKGGDAIVKVKRLSYLTICLALLILNTIGSFMGTSDSQAAILITTKQVLNISENSPVEYQVICREDTYDKVIYKKLGILQFPDGTVIKDFIRLEQVPSCP